MAEDLDDVRSFKNKFVSTSPLHLAYNKIRHPSTNVYKSLIDEGHEISHDRFTSEEDSRIKRNWKKFCKHFPHLSDPFLAFGCSNSRPKSEEQKKQPGSNHAFDRRKYKALLSKADFMRRMAYKLDNRMIPSVYYRCKKLLVYQGYTINSKNELSNKTKKYIYKQLTGNDETIQTMSAKLGISPNVLSSIKIQPRTLKPKRRVRSWSKEDDKCLESAIFETHNTVSLPTYLIKWDEVVEKMRDFGYKLIKRQLYKRWHKLNPQLVGLANKQRIFAPEAQVRPEHNQAVKIKAEPCEL